MTDTIAWQYAHLTINAAWGGGGKPLLVQSSITTSGGAKELPSGTVESNQSMVGCILTVLDVVGAEGWQVSSYNSSSIGTANAASWYEAWLRRPAQ